MTLPIDRTAKSTLDANLVNGITSDAPALKANDDVLYNTIDELNNKVDALIASGALSPYPPAQYNQLINGNFDVWQRGMTLTPFIGNYLADRWYCADVVSATFSKQTASPPQGSDAYARITINANAGYLNIAQAFESDICNKLKGKTVSISIQMRKDSTFDGQHFLQVDKNAVANTSGGTWTPVKASSTINLSTSWAVYKLENVQIPSDANGLRLSIWTTGGVRPANSFVEISQAQINLGNIALTYQPKSFAEELVLCQRFYEKSYDYATAFGTSVTDGIFYMQTAETPALTGTRIRISAPFKVQKRTVGTMRYWDLVGNGSKITKISSDTQTNNITPATSVFSNISQKGFIAISADGPILFHWDIDAEI